ncbi:MAG: DUF3500 domain-containing protein [Planctomycetota bacterium]
MKRLVQLSSVFLLAAAVMVGRAQRPESADEVARAAVVRLFQSLSDEQKKAALLAYDDKDKFVEAFPAVTRKGIAYAKLTAEQRGKIDDVIRAMTSAYGAERCLELAKQTPDGSRYLTFFGDPSTGKAFAWRVGMHHLTLLFAEFGTDPVNDFGPILLGGNPVKTLWDAEEKIALEFYAALTPEEAKAIQGKGGNGSGSPIGKNGIKIADLNPKAKELAKQLLAKRLDVFSSERRKVADRLVQGDGGAEALNVAVWGDMSKGQADGGTYSWRIGGPSFLADWQTAGKQHIHMTVKGKAKA